ncbi:hypothetical protein BP5796_07663 [Coleophoma crateriformis]|uniref:Uncharacterized protein n=1 Tax=Coleophoma crateriformis TaxID=565419 RepID=A0A3D8RK59_9HELO|nr:hypothetical protein BP5796_07663 [Coleophoma crateriformis]
MLTPQMFTPQVELPQVDLPSSPSSTSPGDSEPSKPPTSSPGDSEPSKPPTAPLSLRDRLNARVPLSTSRSDAPTLGSGVSVARRFNASEASGSGGPESWRARLKDRVPIKVPPIETSGEEAKSTASTSLKERLNSRGSISSSQGESPVESKSTSTVTTPLKGRLTSRTPLSTASSRTFALSESATSAPAPSSWRDRLQSRVPVTESPKPVVPGSESTSQDNDVSTISTTEVEPPSESKTNTESPMKVSTPSTPDSTPVPTSTISNGSPPRSSPAMTLRERLALRTQISANQATAVNVETPPVSAADGLSQAAIPTSSPVDKIPTTATSASISAIVASPLPTTANLPSDGLGYTPNGVVTESQSLAPEAMEAPPMVEEASPMIEGLQAVDVASIDDDSSRSSVSEISSMTDASSFTDASSIARSSLTPDISPGDASPEMKPSSAEDVLVAEVSIVETAPSIDSPPVTEARTTPILPISNNLVAAEPLSVAKTETSPVIESSSAVETPPAIDSLPTIEVPTVESLPGTKPSALADTFSIVETAPVIEPPRPMESSPVIKIVPGVPVSTTPHLATEVPLTVATVSPVQVLPTDNSVARGESPLIVESLLPTEASSTTDSSLDADAFLIKDVTPRISIPQFSNIAPASGAAPTNASSPAVANKPMMSFLKVPTSLGPPESGLFSGFFKSKPAKAETPVNFGTETLEQVAIPVDSSTVPKPLLGRSPTVSIPTSQEVRSSRPVVQSSTPNTAEPSNRVSTISNTSDMSDTSASKPNESPISGTVGTTIFSRFWGQPKPKLPSTETGSTKPPIVNTTPEPPPAALPAAPPATAIESSGILGGVASRFLLSRLTAQSTPPPPTEDIEDIKAREEIAKLNMEMMAAQNAAAKVNPLKGFGVKKITEDPEDIKAREEIARLTAEMLAAEGK